MSLLPVSSFASMPGCGALILAQAASCFTCRKVEPSNQVTEGVASCMESLREYIRNLPDTSSELPTRAESLRSLAQRIQDNLGVIAPDVLAIEKVCKIKLSKFDRRDLAVVDALPCADDNFSPAHAQWNALQNYMLGWGLELEPVQGPPKILLERIGEVAGPVLERVVPGLGGLRRWATAYDVAHQVDQAEKEQKEKKSERSSYTLVFCHAVGIVSDILTVAYLVKLVADCVFVFTGIKGAGHVANKNAPRPVPTLTEPEAAMAVEAPAAEAGAPLAPLPAQAEAGSEVLRQRRGRVLRRTCMTRADREVLGLDSRVLRRRPAAKLEASPKSLRNVSKSRK